MKVRNSMSTQSHKILTQEGKNTKKERRSWRKRENRLGRKRKETSRRKYPRKCGTICPRRILDKIDKRGEGRKRRSKKVRNNMPTQNLRQVPNRRKAESAPALMSFVFFLEVDPQDSGKNWDLWRKFLEKGPQNCGKK